MIDAEKVLQNEYFAYKDLSTELHCALYYALKDVKKIDDVKNVLLKLQNKIPDTICKIVQIKAQCAEVKSDGNGNLSKG